MKSVLISIRPKWCELIANGKKTIEVRKTKPKMQTPFKVYIYQTMKPVSVSFNGNGKHISEYDKTLWYNSWSGKVIGEFICNCVEHFDCSSYDFEELSQRRNSCLTLDELLNYCNGRDLYGWHISNLIVYDKPKELNQFMLAEYNYGKIHLPRHEISRAPQSWCYVEEAEK